MLNLTPYLLVGGINVLKRTIEYGKLVYLCLPTNVQHLVYLLLRVSIMTC